MTKVKQEEKAEVDFVQLVKEAVQAHGASTFVRVNLPEEVSSEGKESLFNEYSVVSIEPFFSADDKSVLLLKQ